MSNRKEIYNSVYEVYKCGKLLSVGTIKEISKELGIGTWTLYKYRDPAYRESLKKKDKAMILKRVEKPKQYAMYKGDTFITLGTLEEIAKEVGITEQTMRFYLTKVYRKRSAKSNKAIVVIEVEDDEDE